MIDNTFTMRITREDQIEAFNARANNYKGEYFGPGITLTGAMNPLDCKYREVKE